MNEKEPTAALQEKARRLVDGGMVAERAGWGYHVTGDSGNRHDVQWGRNRWNCACPAHAYPCSHVLAVEQYIRREKNKKENTMAADQKIVHASAPGVAIQQQSLFPSQWEWQCMREQAQIIVDSGFLPPAIRRPEQALAIILKGRELQIPPMEAISQLYVIGQKVGLQAQLMLGLIRRTGKYGYKVTESTAAKCTVEMWPYAHPDEKYTSTFTMQDAKQAGLLNNPTWTKYPAQMLRARAVSAAARLVCPEVIGGLYTPEELGAEVTVTAEGDIEVAAPAHDPETGEIIEAEWEPEPEPEPDMEPPQPAPYAAPGATPDDEMPQGGATPPAEGPAAPDPVSEEIAKPWAWPVKGEKNARLMMAKLGYAAQKISDEIRGVTAEIQMMALAARLKQEQAAKDAAARTPPPSIPIDFEDYGHEQGNGRVDEPLPESEPESRPDAPFGDDDSANGAAGYVPGHNEPTDEEAARWLSVWDSAESAVSGQSVPEDLALVITRKEIWRKYLMSELGQTFAAQEALVARFELGAIGQTTPAQRLALIWWLQKDAKAKEGQA